MCPASALPSAGGSKFDKSALIDADFESMRCFAPAQHLMSFDITPLIMLLVALKCVILRIVRGVKK
jgi:hypothetical protein